MIVSLDLGEGHLASGQRGTASLEQSRSFLIEATLALGEATLESNK